MMNFSIKHFVNLIKNAYLCSKFMCNVNVPTAYNFAHRAKAK